MIGVIVNRWWWSHNPDGPKVFRQKFTGAMNQSQIEYNCFTKTFGSLTMLFSLGFICAFCYTTYNISFLTTGAHKQLVGCLDTKYEAILKDLIGRIDYVYPFAIIGVLLLILSLGLMIASFIVWLTSPNFLKICQNNVKPTKNEDINYKEVDTTSNNNKIDLEDKVEENQQ